MTQTDPIFEIGPVPKLPHCVIQHRQYKAGKWKYFVQNNYNAYASGWGDEDWIIDQIAKHANNQLQTAR